MMAVAGSDSGGGAGIQADLKTFDAVGVHGTCVVTGITAQSPANISNMEPVSEKLIEEQFNILTKDLPPNAIKVGALFSSGIVQKVTSLISEFIVKTDIPVVIDPVMVATSGKSLYLEQKKSVEVDEKSTEACLVSLFSLGDLITPNIPEAESLLGRKITSKNELKEATVCLFKKFNSPIFIKGGHLDPENGMITDYLYDGEKPQAFELPYQKIGSLHGTGCTLSSSIAAYLAKGEELVTAIQKSKLLTNYSIRDSYKIGRFKALNVCHLRTNQIDKSNL